MDHDRPPHPQGGGQGQQRRAAKKKHYYKRNPGQGHPAQGFKRRAEQGPDQLGFFSGAPTFVPSLQDLQRENRKRTKRHYAPQQHGRRRPPPRAGPAPRPPALPASFTPLRPAWQPTGQQRQPYRGRAGPTPQTAPLAPLPGRFPGEGAPPLPCHPPNYSLFLSAPMPAAAASAPSLSLRSLLLTPSLPLQAGIRWRRPRCRAAPRRVTRWTS